MARADLTKLLSVVGQKVPPSVSTDGIVNALSRHSGRPVPNLEPLYLSYQRKETRLREEQKNGLTLLARRLSRAKGSGGERITENTLIRVTVDLLLARSAQLAVNDEAALRRSLDLS
jgi:hypothetical protein